MIQQLDNCLHRTTSCRRGWKEEQIIISSLFTPLPLLLHEKCCSQLPYLLVILFTNCFPNHTARSPLKQEMKYQRIIVIRTLLLLTIIMTTIKYPVQAKSRSFYRDRIRLCFWTRCNYAKRCPSYLEQTARRKCKLPNGDIGIYTKCCMFDEQWLITKSGR